MAQLEDQQSPKDSGAQEAPTRDEDDAEGAKNQPATTMTWDADLEKGHRELVHWAFANKNRRNKEQAEMGRRRDAVNALLFHLEYEARPTPLNRDWAEKCFSLVLKHPNLREHFEDSDKEAVMRAQRRFEEEGNQYAGATCSPEPDDEDGMNLPTPANAAVPKAGVPSPTTSNDDLGVSSLKLPAPNHPVWGIDGIMHGFAKTAGTSANAYVMIPNYIHQKGNAKVFGHNGFTPGDWFPYQKVAHFRGCHGHSIAGICGGSEGAYSVVLSNSSYADMDQDNGDKIRYSADHSLSNKDPQHTSDSPATTSLAVSLRTGKPVRVLRNFDRSHKRHWAPLVGMRYDGLYRVVDCELARNRHNGLYKRFMLHRVEVGPESRRNPRSLEELQDIPTAAQRRMFERIPLGY